MIGSAKVTNNKEKQLVSIEIMKNIKTRIEGV